MGKVVKHCTSCDESFAEKFGFCPTCGETLQAFEMNPLGKAEAADQAPFETAPAESEVLARPVTRVEPAIQATIGGKPEIKPVVETSVSPAAPESKAIYAVSKPIDVDTPRSSSPATDTYSSTNDDLFHVTVIEEQNVKQRNSLLLGSLAFMIIVLLSGTVLSIFNKDVEIGAIDDGIFNALLLENVPMTVEEEVQKKAKDDAGGGGGGGREEKEDVTKGDLADQSKNPTRPPDAKVYRSDNFELKMPPPQTQGNKTFPKENKVWGDPNGRFTNFSNGTGSGEGQGSGRGSGQGSGNGSGAGSGNGSGFGSGNGSGNGGGSGDGIRGIEDEPPPRKAGVTKGLAIISKPKPGYTDAARTSNTQGTVVLKVVFLSSGQVGSVSVVKGLPNGLTEKAIEAAKRISFTPKMVDGVAQNVSRPVEFSFAIY